MVLAVALVALIPGEMPEAMAITLGIVGVRGLVRVACDARTARTDPDPQWHTGQALMRFVSSLLAYVISLWAAWQVWGGDPDSLGWLVAVVFLLTMSGAASLWDLFKTMGERGLAGGGLPP